MGRFCGYWKGSKRLERKLKTGLAVLGVLRLILRRFHVCIRQSWNSKTRTFCA